MNPPQSDEEFDVVIPTIGRPTVVAVVGELLLSPRSPREIVVVSQACASIREGVEQNYPTIDASRLHEIRLADRVGAARAREIGLDRCMSDIIAFIDDDIEFVEGDLGQLALFVQRTAGVVAAGGVVEPGDQYHSLALCARRILFTRIFADPRPLAFKRSEPFESEVLSGGVCVTRADACREAFARLPSFPLYSWGEDVALSKALRDHGSIWLVPAVRVKNQSYGTAETGHFANKTDVLRSRARRYGSWAGHSADGLLDWLAFVPVALTVVFHAVKARRYQLVPTLLSDMAGAIKNSKRQNVS